MIDTDRCSVITLDGKEYRLILTTRATKAIAVKYGGLENLGGRLMKNENFEQAIGEVVWLVTLLANQSIMIHNLRDNAHPIPFLTEEAVELLTCPADFAAYKEAITDCLIKGTRRAVESEADPKNKAAE